MSPLKRGLTVIVLLCACTSPIIVSAQEDDGSFGFQVNTDRSAGKSIVQGTLFPTEVSSYPYAECQWTKPGTEKTCKVTLVNRPQPDRTCDNIRVYTDDPDKQLFLNGYFQVVPFSPDFVTVGWWDESKNKTSDKKSNIKISIVNMKNCQSPTIDLENDKAGYGVFPDLLYYPNQVDIIIYSKKACQGLTKCRISYDLNGKQIGSPAPYEPELIGYASPVSLTEPNKGFFESVQLQKSLSVILAQTNGEGKILSTDDYEPNAIKQRIAYSSANELYTSCRMPDKNYAHPSYAYCKQYDSTGKETLNITHRFPIVTKWLAVHSLPNDSFLFATAGCDTAINSTACPDFQVWRANSKKDWLGLPASIKGPNLSCYDQAENLQVRIIEDDKSRFCFDFSCLVNESDLKFVRKCVPKDQLLSLNN